MRGVGCRIGITRNHVFLFLVGWLVGWLVLFVCLFVCLFGFFFIYLSSIADSYSLFIQGTMLFVL